MASEENAGELRKGLSASDDQKKQAEKPVGGDSGGQAIGALASALILMPKLKKKKELTKLVN